MINRRSRWIVSTIILTHLVTVTVSPAAAAPFTVFQKTYVRGTGAPVAVTDTFNVLNPNTTWTAKAINGNLVDSSIEKVSSSTAFLDGVEILKSNQFNQNTSLIEEPVTLKNSNTIKTEVRGKPGGQLTVQIVGDDATPPTVNWLMPGPEQFFNTQTILFSQNFLRSPSRLFQQHSQRISRRQKARTRLRLKLKIWRDF